jgi:uncharacterized protein (DUF169 family)
MLKPDVILPTVLIMSIAAALLYMAGMAASREASGLRDACGETCAALYTDYVNATVYGCICSERELTEEEEERAYRRFVVPVRGIGME